MDEEIKQIESQGSQSKQVAKEALFNTISNILFLGCLWLMTMIVPLVSQKGFETAGIFTLALSVANIATAVATYNISAFFASDVENKFKDNHYFYFGLTSTLASLVAALIVCFAYGYTGEVFWSIILYNVFKLFDNYSFITRIIYHRHGKLTTFSFLLIIRAIASLGLFAGAMLISQSILISMGILALFGLAYFFVELFVLHKKCPGFEAFNKDVYKVSLSIFYHALPVFVYGLCFAAIVTIPRLYFNNVFNDSTLLGYFGTMSSITALIQAVASAMLLPFIPKLANSYLSKNGKELAKLLGLLSGVVIVLTAIAFLAVILLGDFALKLVYGEAILEYSSVFKWLVLAAGIQSLAIVFSDSIVSIRRFGLLMLSSVGGLAAMIVSMFLLIPRFGTYGVTYVYMISFGFALITLFLSFVNIIKKMRES